MNDNAAPDGVDRSAEFAAWNATADELALQASARFGASGAIAIAFLVVAKLLAAEARSRDQPAGWAITRVRAGADGAVRMVKTLLANKG